MGNNHNNALSSFAPTNNAAPPKKPPRRNLSVSPTHTGQHFTYTSPNHQQQMTAAVSQSNAQQQIPIYASICRNKRTQHRSPSNDSPYSHQSQGSISGISLDETHLRDRQRGDRLYASARESTRSSGGVSLSSSSKFLSLFKFLKRDVVISFFLADMLEVESYSNDECNENYVPNQDKTQTNSMKRPIPAPRSSIPIPKEIKNCENPTLKSYNPNRKLKRNRNSRFVSCYKNNILYSI